MTFKKKLNKALFEADEQLPLFPPRRDPAIKKKKTKIDIHTPVDFRIYYVDRIKRPYDREFTDIIEIKFQKADKTTGHTAWRGSERQIRQAIAIWNKMKVDLNEHGKYYGWVRKHLLGPYDPLLFL